MKELARRRLGVAGRALLALSLHALPASSTADARKMAVISQTPERIAIRDGKYYRGDQEVVLLGANYVYKQQPYFPPKDQVDMDAHHIATTLASSRYVPQNGKDGNPRPKVPMVRLGAMFEGMMPNAAGEIDAAWLDRLKDTVAAFAGKNVYVVLDAHSDAWSATNGGEGFPWWMSAWMQEHSSHPDDSYITSPEHPLADALPELLRLMLASLGITIPPIQTLDGDDTPWYNFSVGSGMDPRYMNVGNLNIRLNNNDAAWARGSLLSTKQVQNSMYRFLNSHKTPKDREAIFMPYVHFIKELAKIWEEFPNVIAVELLNEPPPSGAPDMDKLKKSRSGLFAFYAKVLHELEMAGGPLPPVAIQDLGGSLPGANAIFDFLVDARDKISDDSAQAKLHAWAKAGRLICSIHYYPGSHGGIKLTATEFVHLGVKFAQRLGGAAVWLSEFWFEDPQDSADVCRDAAEAGSDMVSWWHYVDSAYTGGQEGWWIYPEHVLAKGVPISPGGVVNRAAWDVYLHSVIGGTFYGGMLMGSAGGEKDVLAKIPAVSSGVTVTHKRRSRSRRFPNIL